MFLSHFFHQVLVTKPDFYNDETRKHLFATLSELISLNIVPIINTNDAVSPPMFVHDDTVVPGTGKKVSKRFNTIFNRIRKISAQDWASSAEL